ncbi:hypothetical protein phytr_7370 [Candidatus Phycorickettsia trachydisci]|uniref:GTPase Der n=1 Tax=Candidatus Phycorickettsia trachydisci TaxID=2115978 RepID=A0A2P1P8V1_9RICK|nr:ribosome biogenesis GTPase Der [Candidatus Phycorickettsia trachydisci]AVP87675.1 hypothetical protein phytr_7370 [Candidatus Phycorickettsia trachydisci]
MLVALVGRTSVGKSTLFNRLTKGGDKSITHIERNVTRDYKIAKAHLFDLSFDVIDTAGIESFASGKNKLQDQAGQKSLNMLKKAELVLFVVDGRVGVTNFDAEIAKFIRKNCSSEVILIINKCEKAINITPDYYRLGFKDPICISAEHGVGMSILHEALKPKIPQIQIEEESEQEDDDTLRLAIVGRPNGGKSTYINSLIEEDRMLTSAIAGTTRDAVDIDWDYRGQKITLIDTAGLRRKSRIDEDIEFLSAKQTINAIQKANVCALVLDAELGLEDQDLKIANLVLDRNKCLILAFNKWDLIEDKNSYKEAVTYTLSRKLSQIQDVPVVYLSAQNKKNIFSLIDTAITCKQKFATKISTSKLNIWLAKVTATYAPPVPKTGKTVKIKYMTQVATNPPTFKLFGNYTLPESYKRYLAKSLREIFDLEGIPIRILFSKSSNPYTKKDA